MILLRCLMQANLAQQCAILAHLKGSDLQTEIKYASALVEQLFAQDLKESDKVDLSDLANLADWEN